MRSALILALAAAPAAAQTAPDAIRFSDAPQHVFAGGVRAFIGARASYAYVYSRSSGLSGHFLADNARAPTGAALRVERDAQFGVTMGAVAEGFLSLNGSERLRYDGDHRVVDAALRRLEVTADHDRIGRLAVGYGPMATDGTLEADLSGTAIVTGADLGRIGGAFEYDESGVGRRIRYRDAALDVDGLGRDIRAAWTSPNWDGVTLSAAADWSADLDVALRYAGAVGDDWRLAAAFGYAKGVESPRNGDGGLWSTSASIRAPWGSSLTIAGAAPDPMRPLFRDKDKAEFFYYAKIGQSFDLFDFGTTALSFDYGFTQWRRQVGEDVEKYGVAATQALWDDRLSLYAALHTSDLDEARLGSVVDEIQTFVAGISVRY